MSLTFKCSLLPVSPLSDDEKSEDSDAPPPLMLILVDVRLRVAVRVVALRSVEEVIAEALTLTPPLLTRITPIPSKDKIRIILFMTD